MATKRVRLGLVGLHFGRSIAMSLLREPASQHIELAALCDLNADRAKAVSAETAVRCTTSLDELLQDPTIDAIGLYTAPVGRSKLVSKIIAAGKHVMTTKPFDLDPDAALAVLREAKRLGRVVHLNSPSPLWSPDLQQIVQWAEEFQLGRIVACRQSVTVRYHEVADGSWYDDPKQCPVAPIFRLGIYGINDMVRLLGDAEKVTAFASRVFTGRPTADNAQASILFTNGAIGNVYATFCNRDGQHHSNSMVINCENGSIYRNTGPFDAADLRGKCHLAVVIGTGPETNEIHRTTVTGGSGSYQWDAFARAVRGEKLDNEVTPEQIVAGLRIVVAMAESEASGTVVTIRQPSAF